MMNSVELIGVEAGGSGIASGKHAARFGDAIEGAGGSYSRYAHVCLAG